MYSWTLRWKCRFPAACAVLDCIAVPHTMLCSIVWGLAFIHFVYTVGLPFALVLRGIFVSGGPPETPGLGLLLLVPGCVCSWVFHCPGAEAGSIKTNCH